MSAKQIQTKPSQSKEKEIPFNSQLEKDSFELYPFAFVRSDEFYLGEREGE